MKQENRIGIGKVKTVEKCGLCKKTLDSEINFHTNEKKVFGCCIHCMIKALKGGYKNYITLKSK